MQSHISISYHESATLGLDPEEEQELSNMVSRHGVRVNINEKSRPSRGGLPTASIISVSAVILVVTGAFVGKILLQETIKDLYAFFKKKLNKAEIDKGKTPEHFAVILKVQCEGEEYQVGVDFKDEATLTIGFFRLHAYLQKPPQSSELVELEYPKREFSNKPLRTILWLSFLTIVIWGVFAFCAMIISEAVGGRERIEPFLKSLVTNEKQEGAYDRAWWILVYTLGVSGFGLALKVYEFIDEKFIRPKLKRSQDWEDYWALKHEAGQWALEVTPLPGIPKDAQIQIHLGDKASDSAK